MYKNVANQKLPIFAWDGALGTPKTGDQANITAQISIDGGVTAATNDVNPTQLDATDAPGVYLFDLTAAETNGNLIIVSAVSSTANVVIRPVFERTIEVMRGTDGANTTVPDAAGTAAGLHAVTDALIAALNDLSVADILGGTIEGAITLSQVLQVLLAFTSGLANGGGTPTINFRNLADTKDRIRMSVNAAGDRLTVTLDLD